MQLKPDEFWFLTPKEFHYLSKGKALSVSHARHERAAIVTSLIYGFRDKKPNLKRIYNDLVGKPKDTHLLEENQDLLAESRARSRIAKKVNEDG